MSTSKFALPPEAPLPNRRLAVGKLRVHETPSRGLWAETKTPWTLEMGTPPDLKDPDRLSRPRKPGEMAAFPARKPIQPGAPAPQADPPPRIFWQSDLRERYDIGRTTLYRWQRSKLLPPPDVIMGRLTGWYEPTIVEFERKTRESRP